nr:MAG TPA: hypothetical protein [Caudoviricetes sp.]
MMHTQKSFNQHKQQSTKHSENRMKLIDLLVKELPRRGGWPDGALNATQDEDGGVNFSEGATPVFGLVAWHDGDWCGNEFHTITASDYDTAIITREQYEYALAASKAVVGHNGWIQWAGGECPVDSDEIVEVKYRKPSPYQFNNDRAGDFTWSHDGIDGDIIAYRLHQTTKSEQVRADAWRDYAGMTEKDEEDDLNECIGQDVAPEWRGEGLPPVGVECEWLASGDHEWIAVTVLCYDGEDAWLKPSDGSQSFVVWNVDNFRPLRSEAEKLRESAINDIALLIGRGTFFQDAERIYDAISSGEIKVYSKENK